jgi:hypothetical protein
MDEIETLSFEQTPTPILKDKQAKSAGEIDTWNDKVLDISIQKGFENTQLPYSPKMVVEQEKQISIAESIMTQDVEDATVVEKFKAMGEVFGQNNDFVQIKK